MLYFHVILHKTCLNQTDPNNGEKNNGFAYFYSMRESGGERGGGREREGGEEGGRGRERESYQF